MAEYFRVIVHHGGFFNAFPEKKYINGQEQVWEEIYPDRWSYFECVGCLKDMGYEKCEALWYKDHLASLKDGLELLRGDRDAAKMAKVGLEHGEVDLYVVCLSVSNDRDDRDDKEVTDGEWSYSEGELESSEDSAFEEDFCDSEDGEGDEGYFEVPIRNYDDILLRDLISKKRRRGNDSKGKESKRSGKVISTSMVICQEGEESETDSLKSMGSGDEDCETGKPFHQSFKMPLSMVDYKWNIGTLFATKDQFKDAIRTYSVHNGKNLKFKRNDNYRIFVDCKEGCEWFAKAYKLKNEDTWQLKQLLDEHSCNREYKVKMMNSKWLSKSLQDGIRENPSMKLSEITSKVHRKWNIGITRYKAGRARSDATELVSGSFSDQYLRLYDYCHELLRSNPGSTVKLKVDRPPDAARVMIELEALTSHTEVPRTLLPTFGRMYVCLKPVKQSFLRCRPIIGLDGYFLKTPYGEEILSAVGRDPNNQMLPLAYAVVEGENKES